MKKQLGLLALLLLVFGSVAARGASVPGTLTPTYLDTAEWLQKVVVGADVEHVGRTISPDGLPDRSLDVYVYSAFVGYDITPHSTVFGTLGSTDDQAPTASHDGSGSGLKASLGANVNLASYDIRHPALLLGDRVQARLLAQVSRYDADTSDWWEGALALPITYEITEGDHVVNAPADERLMLALYAGPQISYLNGKLDLGAQDADFDASQVFGFFAGADLYLTPFVSLGAHVDIFDTDADKVTGAAAFRYHF